MVPQFGKRGSLYLGGAHGCDGAQTYTVNEPYQVERNHFPVSNCRGQVQLSNTRDGLVSEQVTLKDDKGHAEEWHGFQRQAFGAPSLGKEKPGQPSSRGGGTLSRQVRHPNPNRAGPKDTAPRPWPKTLATCPTWPGTWAPTDLGHSEVTGNPSLQPLIKEVRKGTWAPPP